MELEMSDKLQFVAGFHQSHTAENHDKLRFVGHFLSLPAISVTFPLPTPHSPLPKHHL